MSPPRGLLKAPCRPVKVTHANTLLLLLLLQSVSQSVSEEANGNGNGYGYRLLLLHFFSVRFTRFFLLESLTLGVHDLPSQLCVY